MLWHVADEKYDNKLDIQIFFFFHHGSVLLVK